MHDRNDAPAPSGRKRRVKRAALAALVLPVVVGGFMLQSAVSENGQLFQEVLTRVAAFGVDSVPEDSLYALAARGLLRRIGDPYADLYSPQELAEFQRESLRNGYGGMGMLVELVNDTATVMRVYPHTPAEGAGVMVGDRIVEVDGQKVTGLSLDKVTSKLLGPQGTTVHATLVRHGVAQPIPIQAQRAVVHVPVVPYALMLQDNIGYVPLDRFSESSGEELARAVSSLRQQGAHAFIIDLRGNGGGSLEQSIRISNLFLQKGQEILRVAYRNAPNEVYRAEDEPILGNEPVVVMVDGGTASASEIVSGALQDHDRAVVIGTTSFGKGLVQDLFPLEGGWAMKLTTGKWFTPSGRSIQRPRKVNPDGSFVPDDTLPPSDSALRARPVFHSDAGRPVYGGGGITPDVVVKEDTLTAPERTLLRALSSKATATNQVLSQYSLELKATVQPNFAVTPAWRAEILRRLERGGVHVDPNTWNAGATVIDRMLESRVSSLAFGDSASFRRGVARDTQLQTALRVLHGATTQAQALAHAADAARATPAPEAGHTGA
ncbi:MAG: S41 family peptidase, partial [Gemmatimonadetes bacterium]|nr:S41 family peptidase [Gemmatimonadota bacterium]